MDIARKQKLVDFANKIDIRFQDFQLLNTALTHPTYVFEHTKANLESNQRLEFLGDAVLGMVIAEFLYNTYPYKAEGELTKMRAALVCESSLALLARNLNIGQYLLLGKGEELSGGRERPSILADAFEAVIGALFLQIELLMLKKFIYHIFSNQISNVEMGNYGDYKTSLQELVQQSFDDNVSYVIVEEKGPDHNKSFIAGVVYKGSTIAMGQGRSKKEAEQKAAQKALEDCSWLTK
ncbi:MAG: ribonuclease III [Bacillota bacterium]|nr:ribonuclease III [Bacillota bacterium]